MKLWVCFFLAFLAEPFLQEASAHDQWADGSAIPAWVKSSCCGPADAHLLSPSDVSLQDDGWHIKGLGTIVRSERVLPSQDGQIWGFWNDADGPNAMVWCFFAPMSF